MSQLTETEIFDCLQTNLRGAAEDCELLAKLPAQGPTYQRFCERLKLIEGACRQAAYWREDAGGVGAPLGFPGAHGFEALRMGETDSAGWLDMAHMVGEIHKRSGAWLRGHYPRELFLKMANVLKEMQRQLERRRTRPTGKTGIVTYPVRPGPHRDTRPVQAILPGWRATPGGLVVPG